jgi:hypothetical protein
MDYRRVWPYLVCDAAAALASAEPQPELLSGDVEAILQIDPKQRKLVRLDMLEGAYIPPADAKGARRIAITLDVELSHDDPTEFLNSTVADWLRKNAEPTGARANYPYKIISATVQTNPDRMMTQRVGGGEGGALVAKNAPPPGARPPGPRPPPAAPPPPRGGGAPAGGAGSGMGAGGARQAPAAPLQAPGGPSGSGMGTGGGDGGSPGGPPAQPRTGPGGAPLPPLGVVPGSGGAQDPSVKDLNDLAPPPTRPQLYPEGATFYKVPITFEVELINPASPTAPTGAAAAASAGGNGAPS